MVESKNLTEAPLGIGFIIEYGLASSLKVMKTQIFGILVVRLDNCSSKSVCNHRDLHVRELASETIYNILIDLLSWLVLLKLHLEDFDLVFNLHDRNLQVKPESTRP